MKSNFDTDVSLENNVLEGEDADSKTDQSVSPEGSREHGSSSPHSSPSKKSASHQIAFSSELPFSKAREVW